MLTIETLRHPHVRFKVNYVRIFRLVSVYREEWPIRIMRDRNIIVVDFTHIFTKDLLRADSGIQVNVRKIHLSRIYVCTECSSINTPLWHLLRKGSFSAVCYSISSNSCSQHFINTMYSMLVLLVFVYTQIWKMTVLKNIIIWPVFNDPVSKMWCPWTFISSSCNKLYVGT